MIEGSKQLIRIIVVQFILTTSLMCVRYVVFSY